MRSRFSAPHYFQPVRLLNLLRIRLFILGYGPYLLASVPPGDGDRLFPNMNRRRGRICQLSKLSVERYGNRSRVEVSERRYLRTVEKRSLELSGDQATVKRRQIESKSSSVERSSSHTREIRKGGLSSKTSCGPVLCKSNQAKEMNELRLDGN